MTNQTIIKGAFIGGIINAILNGIINWFQLDKTKNILLTTDVISTHEHTVFGGAVILGTTLAFILTSIAYLTTKTADKPNYFPTVFILALKQSVFAFGVITIFALLFQRTFGSHEVSPLYAAIITGCIAGLAAGIIEYTTKTSLLKN